MREAAFMYALQRLAGAMRVRGWRGLRQGLSRVFRRHCLEKYSTCFTEA
jgi:hypothetical protein